MTYTSINDVDSNVTLLAAEVSKMASFDGTISPRLTNFSSLEVEVMVDEIVQRYGSLVGKLSDRLSFFA